MAFNFFNQTFSLIDIPTVLLLALIECALSSDNALVLAGIIKQLPESRRDRALWTGFVSAIFLRLLAIGAVAYFIHYFWVQILGAFYLLYLSLAYRLQSRKPAIKKKRKIALWKIVIQIEVTDLIFAFDSIIAGLAITGITISSFESLPPKMWIIYLGGLIGLVGMRFAAKILAKLMERFANLEKASHYLIGWVAIKLGIESIQKHFYPESHSYIYEIIFWVIAVGIVLYGFLPKKNHKRISS